MQRYTVFFITVNVVQVSGGFSAHHQGFKNRTHSIGYMSILLAAITSVGELKLTHISCSGKKNSPTLVVAASKLDIYPVLCVKFLSS
jgi:hypothetical protein